jgi:hypothetical protein
MPKTKVDRPLLCRRWTHAHEEDDGGNMIFRPSEQKFPPSRGRRSFDLRTDGTMTESRPGPTDQHAEGRGKWTVDDAGVLNLVSEGAGSTPRAFDVVEVTKDRLVLKPRP